jgi:hypothetical protein
VITSQHASAHTAPKRIVIHTELQGLIALDEAVLARRQVEQGGLVHRSPFWSRQLARRARWRD